MRTLFTIFALSAIGFVGCTETQQSSTPAADSNPVPFNLAGNPTVEIDVPGLHCENCSATACSLLVDIPGVVDVKADSTAKKATIAVDESTFDSEAARHALEDTFGEATIVDDQAAVEVEVSGEES